jgi:hypothetical protein
MHKDQNGLGIIKRVILSRMNLWLSLYLAALFVAFVPGVLVTLPKGASKMTVLIVHALLFTLVWHFTHKMVWELSEGFQNRKVKVSDKVKATMEKVKKQQSK